MLEITYRMLSDLPDIGKNTYNLRYRDFVKKRYMSG